MGLMTGFDSFNNQHFIFSHLSAIGSNFNIDVKYVEGSLGSLFETKTVSEYDQEIPQSQTADNPMAPQGRAAQPSRDTRKTN